MNYEHHKNYTIFFFQKIQQQETQKLASQRNELSSVTTVRNSWRVAK